MSEKEKVEGTEVAVKEVGALVEKKQSFVEKIFAEVKNEFLSVNAGMDLDFVYLGTWLVIDSKGRFVDADDETVVYGDEIEVVVAQGEQKFMVWGLDKTPESGKVLVGESTREKALEKLNEVLEASPDLTGYSEENIQSKYLAYVIPVETLAEEVPKIYLLSMPGTAKIKWGKYAFDGLFKGKYKAIGIPAKTAVNQVVTKIVTKEQINADKQKYTTMEFEAIKMFKIEDYRPV